MTEKQALGDVEDDKYLHKHYRVHLTKEEVMRVVVE